MSFDKTNTLQASQVVKTAQPVTEQSKGDDLIRIYKNWLKDGDSFNAVGDVSVEGELKKSAYKVRQDSYGRIFFDRVKPKTAELYKFKSGPMEEVLSELDRFWGLRDDYKKLGLMYTRGILMYGPPGGGKTSICNQVVDMITGRGDIVVYGGDLNITKAGLQQLRSVEPDRRLIVVFEDADEYLRYDEQSFLHLLDGQDSTDGIVYLASTNYIDKFPQRLLRSGRFDKKVYVPNPPYDGRLTYFRNKLKKHDLATDKEIEALSNETDGLSFGDLLEVVTAVYALKEKKDDVLKRLKEGADKTGEVPADATSASRFHFPLSLPSFNSVKAAGHLDLGMVKKVIGGTDELV